MTYLNFHHGHSPQIAIFNIQHPSSIRLFGASDHLICHEFFGGHDNLQALLIKGKGLEARQGGGTERKKKPQHFGTHKL